MNNQSIIETFQRQDEVISRSQLLSAGLSDNDIRRLLRKRELVRVVPGVFAHFTNRIDWVQRVWAGCLAYRAVAAGPTALQLWLGDNYSGNAIRVTSGTSASTQGQAIHLGVRPDTNPRKHKGFKLSRLADFERRALPQLSPPRERLEDAALSVAASLGESADAIEVLAKVLRSRQTTPERLLTSLRHHPKLAGRLWLKEAIRDIGGGAHSVLEREFLRRVERPHGLPPATRQVRQNIRGHICYQDGQLLNGAIALELDGYLFHTGFDQHQRDLERDLISTAKGQRTVRIGWRQVLNTPCLTAVYLAEILVAEGWGSQLTPCGPRCAAHKYRIR